MRSGDGLADARSLLGWLGLAAGWRSKMTFIATGADAEQAIAAIQRRFERQFDGADKKPRFVPSDCAPDSKPKRP